MKLLTVTVPCYNSQDYMEKCIDSLLTGGDRVEIIVINDGELFMDGTPREVFSRAEELRRVGLELTQSGELIHELRLAGLSGLPSACLTEDECVEAILRAYRERNGGVA